MGGNSIVPVFLCSVCYKVKLSMFEGCSTENCKDFIIAENTIHSLYGPLYELNQFEIACDRSWELNHEN